LEAQFIAFGDWGTGDANQLAVASALHQYCQSASCDFAFLLGDNFYPTGVTGTSDAQWQSKFRDVYGDMGLSFYALLGNHDWDPPAEAQAEIEYSLLDSSWEMPAAYYSESFPSEDDALLEVFVINSNDFKDNLEEQAWLNGRIDQSTARWKIVAFHHPIYSNSSNHPADEKQIYAALKPLICGKADLLLSGHDHLFSHLRNAAENCGYDQLIVGTGGKSLYASSGSAGSAEILYTESSFGFAHFSLSQETITLRFIRADGAEAYSYQWQK